MATFSPVSAVVGSKLFVIGSATGAMLSGTLLIDTGIRLKPHDHFGLYRIVDQEVLGILFFYMCGGLAVHLHPFIHCLHCREYLFTVEKTYCVAPHIQS